MSTTVILSVATFVLLSSVVEAELPNGECDVYNMSCELEGDNLIGIINGVASTEECKQQCLDDAGLCEVYTYYGPAGVPFRDSCLLFTDCLVLDPVEDCFTEDVGPDCTSTCNAPFEGILGENLIDYAVDVTQEACASECEALLGCHVYTYHYANSTSYPETCFLLTSIQKPVSICSTFTCLTGSPGK